METLTNDFSAISSPQDFNLSHNESLRTLEVTELSILMGRSNIPGIKQALSTIRSLAFSQVIVLYQDEDFSGECPHRVRDIFWYRKREKSWRTPGYQKIFRILHEMCEIRDFRLVLCADVWGYVRKYAMSELEWVISEGCAKWGLGKFSSRLSVTSFPRRCGIFRNEERHPVTNYYASVRATPPLYP
jgi:hypothetical protein